jgi:hypothetical protein
MEFYWLANQRYEIIEASLPADIAYTALFMFEIDKLSMPSRCTRYFSTLYLVSVLLSRTRGSAMEGVTIPIRSAA